MTAAPIDYWTGIAGKVREKGEAAAAEGDVAKADLMLRRAKWLEDLLATANAGNSTGADDVLRRYVFATGYYGSQGSVLRIGERVGPKLVMIARAATVMDEPRAKRLVAAWEALGGCTEDET